ncbi:hypothetical protein PCANC_23269 [Puccinia coronata f. sp. avenae]|uniref:Uncharacterized protein n=1 Tax=Puccinia coronata f. sp. avenae TaxID=200324 RepID=A0A2N5TY36_9BASI|nr:hypothetical protein PCANC_23269 [Puccinia coronata f. sp. avenae]
MPHSTVSKCIKLWTPEYIKVGQAMKDESDRVGGKAAVSSSLGNNLEGVRQFYQDHNYHH